MNTRPLVSVIIPAYNAEQFIAKTLNSVLGQTYQHLEILVIDDGSEDATAKIVQEFAQKDRRIQLMHQVNAGVAAARNLGIKKARGEFIAPIDADDIWYPQNLEKQVKVLLENQSAALSYAWSLDIDEADLLCGGFHVAFYQGYVYPLLIYQNFIGNASAVLIRRDCLEKIGGYNRQLKEQNAQGCEDWDLYLRIAEYYPIQVVPDYLIGYRQTTGTMSRNYERMVQSLLLVFQAVQDKYPHIPNYIYHWSFSNFYIYLANQNSSDQNYQQAFGWLSKAFKLDWTMTIIRPDPYFILLEWLAKSIIPKMTKKQDNQAMISSFRFKDRLIYRSETIELSRIKTLIKISQFLPSKIYEQWRLNFLKKLDMVHL